RIISETLKIGYKNKTEVEESMEQIFIVEVAKMTKGLSTIKTIIELAPFLGLIGTVIGIWMTFKSLGVHPDSAAMAEGIYIALTTTIMGLLVAIVLLPVYTYIQGLIESEMDKIELATKMTNWGYAVVNIRVDSNVECALEALQEAEGVVNARLISDPYANIKVSFKPSMLDKSIANIILEKCNVNAEITESKLRQ
ncbi:MotA/TolQ/ExbB proton channel family protein, partial [Methanobrevibacter sp. UBA212]